MLRIITLAIFAYDFISFTSATLIMQYYARSSAIYYSLLLREAHALPQFVHQAAREAI